LMNHNILGVRGRVADVEKEAEPEEQGVLPLAA